MAKKATPHVPAEILAGLHAACRDGDEHALLAWADALEEAGDRDSAALLRRLPQARDEFATTIDDWRQSYPGDGSLSLHTNGDESYWFCGDCEMGSSSEGDEAITTAGQLLRGWDRFHPAIEWLLRQLRLPHVEGMLEPLKGRRRTSTQNWTLGPDTHLAPIPPDLVVRALYARESMPGQ
jgi:hypothetical protein